MEIVTPKQLRLFIPQLPEDTLTTVSRITARSQPYSAFVLELLRDHRPQVSTKQELRGNEIDFFAFSCPYRGCSSKVLARGDPPSWTLPLFP